MGEIYSYRTLQRGEEGIYAQEGGRKEMHADGGGREWMQMGGGREWI
jgi:hypothetical protein